MPASDWRCDSHFHLESIEYTDKLVTSRRGDRNREPVASRAFALDRESNFHPMHRLESLRNARTQFPIGSVLYRWGYVSISLVSLLQRRGLRAFRMQKVLKEADGA